MKHVIWEHGNKLIPSSANDDKSESWFTAGTQRYLEKRSPEETAMRDQAAGWNVTRDRT